MTINNTISVSKKHHSLLNNSDVYLEEIQRKYQHHSRPYAATKTKVNHRQRENKKIFENGFSFLLPQGYEKVFLALYTLILPYIAGIVFLFFYISKRDISVFTSICDSHSPLFTWCIGYEIVAILLLLILMKQSISFVGKSKRTHFQRP